MHLDNQWTTREKLGFRFVFIFFSLFILPFPISNILGFFNEYSVNIWVNDFWNSIANFITIDVLGNTEIAETSPGSGDTTKGWVTNATKLILAILGASLWTILDKKHKSHFRLWRIFTLFIVYYVFSYMIVYGFAKIYYNQMTPLSIHRLLNTYGQSSPMGVLWSFMSSSKTYSMYAGWSEVIAGVLLLFRRTRTLGGMVTFGVMFNVFMLNMSYDVPVKLFSAQLMFMGLYIAMIDYKSIFNLLLLGKSFSPYQWGNFFSSKRNNYILLALQLAFIFMTVYSQHNTEIERQYAYGIKRTKNPLYGLYDVMTYVKNGDTIPPLLTDNSRFQRMIFDYNDRIIVKMMDERNRFYLADVDTTEQLINFKIGRDTAQKVYPIHYQKVEGGLELNGVLMSDTLQMELKTYDLSKFYLTNRGFHWVNEVPYHRYDPVPKPNW